MVEAVRCIPRELKVLSLILTDRYMGGSVNFYVSTWQSRQQSAQFTGELKYQLLEALDMKKDPGAVGLELRNAPEWCLLAAEAYSILELSAATPRGP